MTRLREVHAILGMGLCSCQEKNRALRYLMFVFGGFLELSRLTACRIEMDGHVCHPDI